MEPGRSLSSGARLVDHGLELLVLDAEHLEFDELLSGQRRRRDALNLL